MGTPRAWDTFMGSTGYDRRPTQDELVELITETLNNRGHLLARAGTGTGKSIAAVIPALSYAITRASAQQGGPVIVSTATKALQGQYHQKDLPFMVKHFTNPSAKTKGFTHALLKGKKNYLCLDRFANPAGAVDPGNRKRLELLVADPNWSGDIATLNPSLPRYEEAALTTTTADCPGKNDCMAHFDAVDTGGCFYEKAKNIAAGSEVMVVNHALLASHLKVLAATKGSITILPEASVFVLDECHKFGQYMQGALGWTMSQVRLYKWANDCLETSEELEAFKATVRAFFGDLPYDTDDKKNAQQIVERGILRRSVQLGTILVTVDEAMDEWMETARDTRATEDWKKVARCGNLLADLKVALDPTPEDNFWLELDKRGDKILNYKPSEAKVADFLAENMWPKAPAILLSATTPAPSTLGLPDDTEEFDADSPFDFKRNSRLYISKLDGSAPREPLERQIWEQRRHAEMLNLVAASDGRALLLFTSWMDLNKAHEELAPKFRKAGVTVLKQDRDNESERDRLAKAFKEDEQSVLFGTESFFEGIDIPGKSLQLVVISKLPFPAMVDNTRGGKLDFKKEMLPEMRMKLVQAAGRLIRSHEDRGLVAVLDSRLLTKGYGKNVLANISPFNEMTYVSTLQEAMDYLESLEDE